MMVYKLQAPGMGNTQEQFEDREVAPLDPKAAQGSSSGSRGDSLCFCSSARCWFCVEGTQVGTIQSCAGMLTPPSYSWSTSQDAGSLLPSAYGETLVPGQNLKPAS